MAENNTRWMMSTNEVAVFVAGLKGRDRPYTAETVRRWIQEQGLPAEEAENGRLVVNMIDLKEWAKAQGMIDEGESKPKLAPAPVSAPVSTPEPGKAPAATPQQEASRENPDGAPASSKDVARAGRLKAEIYDEDAADDLEPDVEVVECPNCKAELLVSTNAVLVECGECQALLRIRTVDEDEEDEPEPPAAAAPAIPPAPTPVTKEPTVKGNPTLLGFRLSRKRR